ncbi:hypothetical protein VYU27_002312 [Nannochloropsis oceanica]
MLRLPITATTPPFQRSRKKKGHLDDLVAEEWALKSEKVHRQLSHHAVNNKQQWQHQRQPTEALRGHS